MKKLTFSSVLLTLVLSACGGGGSDSPASPTTAAGTPTTPTRSTTPQVIEYYGDSTIWGYRSWTGERVPVTAPQAFAQALPSQPSHQVINEGRSSTTSCQLRDGTDDAGTGEGPHAPWATQMAQSRATHVIINHGINDALRSNTTAYRTCLQDLARIAKARGKQVIFETPNPIAPNVGNVEPFVQVMREVAAQERIPVIDQFQKLTNDLQGRSVTTICPDGVHPSDQVYITKGQYAAARYAELFP